MRIDALSDVVDAVDRRVLLARLNAPGDALVKRLRRGCMENFQRVVERDAADTHMVESHDPNPNPTSHEWRNFL